MLHIFSHHSLLFFFKARHLSEVCKLTLPLGRGGEAGAQEVKKRTDQSVRGGGCAGLMDHGGKNLHRWNLMAE